jgi:hypothetical protein
MVTVVVTVITSRTIAAGERSAVAADAADERIVSAVHVIDTIALISVRQRRSSCVGEVCAGAVAATA